MNKNLLKGLVIAVIIQFMVIGAYYLNAYLSSDEEKVPTVSVRLLNYSDLGPPPSISATPLPPTAGLAAPAKSSIGTPVPVPDVEVNPEQTIATQAELSSVPSPALEDLGKEESNVQVTQDIKIDNEKDPSFDEFIPMEKEPQIVSRAVPVYPEMAIRAGLEGKVWVKVLVDKDGTVKKAVVLSTTVDILNEAAVAAAMKFKFTPAVMNEGPVRVWVAIPFKFQLVSKTAS